jgi:hypothetical protein
MPFRTNLSEHQRELIVDALNAAKWQAVAMANLAKREHRVLDAAMLHNRSREFAELATLVAMLPEQSDAA